MGTIQLTPFAQMQFNWNFKNFYGMFIIIHNFTLKSKFKITIIPELLL